MSEENNKIKKELEDYRVEYGFIKEEWCTYEENQKYEQILKEGGTLPDGVKPSYYEDGERSGMYYTVHEEKLTDTERLEYLSYKKLSLLRSIKALAIILLVIGILSLILIISVFNEVDYIYENVKDTEEALKNINDNLRRYLW